MSTHSETFRPRRVAVRPVSESDPLHCRVFAPQSTLRQTRGGTQPTPAHPESTHLPIVLWDHDGGIIVDGHRRMAAAHTRGETTVPAFVLDESTSRATVAAIASTGRPELTGAETVVLFRKLCAFLDGDADAAFRIVRTTAADGQRAPDAVTLGAAALLPDAEINALHALAAPPSLLSVFVDAQQNERGATLLLVTRLHFTVSQTRELCRGFRFLRGRGSFDPMRWALELIETRCVAGADALAALRQVSHPEYSDRRAAIDQAIAALSLPSTARVQVPEHLEGHEVSCYFRFSSAEEFRQHISRLEDALERGGIDRLLDELNP